MELFGKVISFLVVFCFCSKMRFSGESVGQIEIGFRADFIVLDGNWWEDAKNNPLSIYQTQVRQTWVDGEKVYMNRDEPK